MSRVGINELFDESRFPTGWSAMPLLFYFPLGLALSTIRFFIGFQAYLAASLLPQLTLIRSFVLRSMSLVLGIVVQQESLGNRDKSVKVIVANYLTPFDHLAMHLVEGTVTPNSWGWPSSLGEAVGVMDLGVKQGSESLIQNAANHLMKPSAAPLFAQPEGGSTNGKKGLLKFSTWPFSLGSACTSVQPVALSVWRPGITDLSPSPLASRPWMDLFWFLFVPFTLFTISHVRLLASGVSMEHTSIVLTTKRFAGLVSALLCKLYRDASNECRKESCESYGFENVGYLPCVQKKEGETNEEFSDRVQELVAANLNLIPTKYTVADKAEHEKRHLMELARASLAPSHSSVAANPSFNVRSRIRSPMSLSSSSEIQRMARQVKEVLPHVPIDAITRDLVRTLSVDVTIANILEGQVAFQPEPTTPAPSPATAKPSTKYSPTCSTPFTPSSSPMSSSLDTSAPSFPKTASERMLSFQQRKDRLIENARRKYIEKNGLKIAGFNC